MATTQVAQASSVMEELRKLAGDLGYEVVVQPGAMDAVGVVVWEIATVSVNSRFPIDRQAEELVDVMALLVERLERGGSDPELTFCRRDAWLSSDARVRSLCGARRRLGRERRAALLAKLSA